MHQMIAERILFLSYPYLIISTPSFLNLPPTGLLNNLDCAWPQHTAYLTKKRKKRNLMSHCGRIIVCVPYYSRWSMRTVNTTLEVWIWQAQVSDYHDSSPSLQRTKWIVQMIQLERNSATQRAIQHAFKWNKSQFSPTADAQRTVKWAL